MGPSGSDVSAASRNWPTGCVSQNLWRRAAGLELRVMCSCTRRANASMEMSSSPAGPVPLALAASLLLGAAMAIWARIGGRVWGIWGEKRRRRGAGGRGTRGGSGQISLSCGLLSS